MHESTFTYDRRKLAAAAVFAAVVAALLVVLAWATWLAPGSGSGITPAPVPNAPASPVEPAPLGPPTVLIPDNA